MKWKLRIQGCYLTNRRCLARKPQVMGMRTKISMTFNRQPSHYLEQLVALSLKVLRMTRHWRLDSPKNGRRATATTAHEWFFSTMATAQALASWRRQFQGPAILHGQRVPCSNGQRPQISEGLREWERRERTWGKRRERVTTGGATWHSLAGPL